MLNDDSLISANPDNFLKPISIKHSKDAKSTSRSPRHNESSAAHNPRSKTTKQSPRVELAADSLFTVVVENEEGGKGDGGGRE